MTAVTGYTPYKIHDAMLFLLTCKTRRHTHVQR